MSTNQPERPLYVMLKPVGAACNLACTYCYYLEKEQLYPHHSQCELSDGLLEHFTQQYLNTPGRQPVLFTWHGGEPLLRDITFYKKALSYQQQYAQGRPVANTLQTNGTLLTEDWCRFFKKHNFLIGISIDGPQSLHDIHRKRKDGNGSFEQVLQGVRLLQKYDVAYNIMAVVHRSNGDYPIEFYRFFKELGAKYIQFAPIVERTPDGEIAPWSVQPEQWGNFLIAIFQEWIKADVGQSFISYFDAALANWVGVSSGMCLFSEQCGHAGVMEFNGDVYSCDHFVYPEYKLGNLNENSLTNIMSSSQQVAFGQVKSTLSLQCQSCQYLFACRGECPKNRFISTQEGIPQNYLCAGYYKFFQYIAPYMEEMRRGIVGS